MLLISPIAHRFFPFKTAKAKKFPRIHRCPGQSGTVFEAKLTQVVVEILKHRPRICPSVCQAMCPDLTYAPTKVLSSVFFFKQFTPPPALFSFISFVSQLRLLCPPPVASVHFLSFVSRRFCVCLFFRWVPFILFICLPVG